MASKQDVTVTVQKILKAYPQLKFSADSITGFVDLLAEKLKGYPGWLMDEAADKFITTEIDFPHFNIAAILSYCYQARNEKTEALKSQLQTIKDDWYNGEPHKREEMNKLAADFDKLGAREYAKSVRERIDTYTRPIQKATPERIKQATSKIQAAWTEGK